MVNASASFTYITLYKKEERKKKIPQVEFMCIPISFMKQRKKVNRIERKKKGKVEKEK